MATYKKNLICTTTNALNMASSTFFCCFSLKYGDCVPLKILWTVCSTPPSSHPSVQNFATKKPKKKNPIGDDAPRRLQRMFSSASASSNVLQILVKSPDQVKSLRKIISKLMSFAKEMQMQMQKAHVYRHEEEEEFVFVLS